MLYNYSQCITCIIYRLLAGLKVTETHGDFILQGFATFFDLDTSPKKLFQ
jgi:hypothetical protein